MKNFWSSFATSSAKATDVKKATEDKAKLKKSIYALAPMAGITDSAFRQICKSFGADIVYSEMASATALVYGPQKTLAMLSFSEAERPYVVQLFGSKLEHFAKATRLLSEKPPSGFKSHLVALGTHLVAMGTPDGIDINFGCPVKKVVKQGAGAVLMNDLKLAREIVKSVVGSTDLPVSIKIRSKVGRVDALKFLDNLKGLDIKTVMIHGRSLAQGFSGFVDMEIIRKVRNYFGGIILANGGIKSYEDGVEMLAKTQADGLGIARGALGRPWIVKAVRTGQSIKRAKKAVFKIALKQAKLAEKLKGKQGLIEMRKHLCWYTQGLPGARKMRQELVKVENIKDIRTVFKM